MKRDSGRIMTVTGKAANNSWHVIFESNGGMQGANKGTRSHTIKERAIYRFYYKL